MQSANTKEIQDLVWLDGKGDPLGIVQMIDF